MKRTLSLLLVALFSCSRQEPRSAAVDVRSATVTDSVVLERTRCYGTCPAYRLRVSRTGEVSFVSRYPGNRTAVDTVESSIVDSIAGEMNRIGFFSLPDSVIPGRPFCDEAATDLPTITVSVFGSRAKRVVYYLGCIAPKDPTLARSLRSLPDIANHIDALTRSERWTRPVGKR